MGDDAEKLRVICAEMDDDNDRRICWDEFSRQIRTGKLRAYLSTLGLNIKDAESFFKILMTMGDGDSVNIEAFIQGCLRMQGQATSLDIQTLLFVSESIHKR